MHIRTLAGPHSLDSSATLNYVTAPVKFELPELPEVAYRPATVRFHSTGPLARAGTPDSTATLALRDVRNTSILDHLPFVPYVQFIL